MKITRQAYAEMFGPTVGDRVAARPTPSLWIEVEKDFTVYGEEVKFGGGQGDPATAWARASASRRRVADTVITNALILDHWGIVKARHRLEERPASGRSARRAIPMSSRR